MDSIQVVFFPSWFDNLTCFSVPLGGGTPDPLNPQLAAGEHAAATWHETLGEHVLVAGAADDGT